MINRQFLSYFFFYVKKLIETVLEDSLKRGADFLLNDNMRDKDLAAKLLLVLFLLVFLIIIMFFSLSTSLHIWVLREAGKGFHGVAEEKQI